MQQLAVSQQRLKSFLAEVVRATEESKFPYPDSRDALLDLKALFEQKLRLLDAFDQSSARDVVAQQCRVALRDVFMYLPLIGFVLRSLSVRNSFEAFGPFLRLVGDVLEPGIPFANRTTKLVFSSEWDYSPFEFYFTQLTSFLFIGLPAPESGNPLLLPLAGHELGHAIWRRNSLQEQFLEPANDSITNIIRRRWKEYESLFLSASNPLKPEDLATDLFAVETWRLASDSCLAQAEEAFCDFVGVRIFGASYLSAFAYLLSPGTERDYRYPDSKARADLMLRAASRLGVTAPSEYRELFVSDPEANFGLSAAEVFNIEVADEAVAALVDKLVDEVDRLVDHGAPKTNPAEVARILDRIKKVAPAEKCGSIADILNAAWKAYDDPKLWSEYPKIEARRNDVLKELVLKDLEIFEIERIQAV